ncbi:MAG: insulinase family protein [Oscillospiraceae bacterium]|nr:insulinase family protein [Oscillospiraceae bacterium]
MNKLEYPALGETLYETVLPNGLRIVVARKPGFRKATAMFGANYGGADRRFQLAGEWIDTPAGVAHYLEHKMFDMPDGRNVLAELSAIGANPNAFTGAGMTAYHVTCTGELTEALRILLTYVSTPYYTPESVQKEQGIIGQEIRMYENYPNAVVYFQLMAALYAAHPIREPVAGTVESIAEITPETLYHCHKVFYNPSNMTLAVVGDVDPEQVAALAEEILPAERGETPERDYGPAEGLTPASPSAERSMAVSAPLFCLGAKVEAPAEGRERLRRRILGELALECLCGEASAFYSDLYTRGLLGRDFETEMDDTAGTMTLLMAGESKDPAAVAEALQERVGAVARKGLDRNAFVRCCRARYGAELAGLDSFNSYARTLILGSFGGWNALDVFPILEELTAEDAAAFLCETLSPERVALSVVRPAG